MKKKTWLIIAVAVLCLLVLGITIWCVAGGVKSTLPTQETDPQTEAVEQTPDVSQDEILTVDPVTEDPIVDDNVVVYPWGDLEEEEPVESVPLEEEAEANSNEEQTPTEEELATSDDGWTALY